MAPEHFLHQRVADELSQHPPFSECAGELLLLLAEHTEVQYLHTDKVLFTQGDDLHPFIYTVAKGGVELWKAGEMVDRVDPGEMLGLRTLFETGTYKAEARTLAGKDALLYAIPKDVADQFLLQNPDTAHFFQLDWKGNREDFVPSGISLRRLIKRRIDHIDLPITQTRERLLTTEALSVAPETSLLEVVRQMNESKSDAAIIVDPLHHPLGIITDKDIRRSIASEDFSRERPVEDFMSTPVHTFQDALTYAEAMSAMTEKRIHHLIITADGTSKSALLGMISDHDVLLEQALNPSVISKKLERVRSGKELERLNARIETLRSNYLRADISMSYLMNLMGQFYADLFRASLSLAHRELGPAPCAYTWISFGSLGREEQVLRTDQDHGLVYAEEKHADYFAALASSVSEQMKILGFEEDHFGVSATSNLWRGTPSQWHKRLLSWVQQPDEEALLRLSIVQDARAIAGDTQLALPAFNAFYTKLAQQQNTLVLLAKDALRNPSPLNFFKRFKLEEGGLFDLKLRAILPFIDAAKVLSAAAGKTHLSSTKARLESAKDGSNEELITSAQHAYEILLQLRLKFGQKGGDHGRYFDPAQLDQLDRQLLRNVLKTLEALQAHLKLKFKL